MSAPGDLPQTRPSTGYLASMAAALVGLPCLGTALGGVLIGRSGGDPIDALDNYTTVTFLFMFVLAFAMRLIFWPSAPPALRRAVRALLTAIFALSMPLAVFALVQSLTLPQSAKHSFVAVIFSIFALLCQIGSLTWLLRYRRQGV